MANVLIVDADDNFGQMLARMTQSRGHSTADARSLAQGMQSVAADAFDVVFLDVGLPDGSGLDALPRIADAPSKPEVIIVTGASDAAGAELAIKSGAWDYIDKSASVHDIALALDRALQYRESKTRGPLRAVLVRDNIIDDSPEMQACLRQVAQVAWHAEP